MCPELGNADGLGYASRTEFFLVKFNIRTKKEFQKVTVIMMHRFKKFTEAVRSVKPLHNLHLGSRGPSRQVALPVVDPRRRSQTKIHPRRRLSKREDFQEKTAKQKSTPGEGPPEQKSTPRKIPRSIWQQKQCVLPA